MPNTARITSALKEPIEGKLALVRVQRRGESLSRAASALKKTVSNKGSATGVLIATENDLFPLHEMDVRILLSLGAQVDALCQPKVTNQELIKRRA
jgi:hypothetical protein